MGEHLLGFIIGDRNMVLGFRLVGVEGKEVNSADAAGQALDEAMLNSEIAVVMISQQFSNELRNHIDDIRKERVSPIIMEIPGSAGPQKEIQLSELLSKAIGIKV